MIDWTELGRMDLVVWRVRFFKDDVLYLRPKKGTRRRILGVVLDDMKPIIEHKGKDLERVWSEIARTRMRLHIIGYEPFEAEVPNATILRIGSSKDLETLSAELPEEWLQGAYLPTKNLLAVKDGVELVLDVDDKATRGRQVGWKW